MRLREYLWAYDLTIGEFAKKVRYSHSYVGNVMNGFLTPGPKFIEDVERVTGGQVKAREIVSKKGYMLEKKEKKKVDSSQLTFAEMSNK